MKKLKNLFLTAVTILTTIILFAGCTLPNKDDAYAMAEQMNNNVSGDVPLVFTQYYQADAWYDTKITYTRDEAGNIMIEENKTVQKVRENEVEENKKQIEFTIYYIDGVYYYKNANGLEECGTENQELSEYIASATSEMEYYVEYATIDSFSGVSTFNNPDADEVSVKVGFDKIDDKKCYSVKGDMTNSSEFTLKMALDGSEMKYFDFVNGGLGVKFNDVEKVAVPTN